MTEQASGHPEPDDLFFGSLIRGYVDENPRFLSRDWLMQVLEARLAEPGKRFVLITAEPSAGKSTFMAQVADAYPRWLRYFIRRDQRTVLADVSSKSLLLRLGYQLAAVHPGLFQPRQLELSVEQRIGEIAGGGEVVGAEIKRLRASPFYRSFLRIEQQVQAAEGSLVGLRVEELTVEPRLLEAEDLLNFALIDPALALQRTDPAGRIVVLIDSLDEIRYHDVADNIVTWLTNCPALPHNIRFVLTSRPHDEAVELFQAEQESLVREITIGAEDPLAVRDVERFATRLVSEDDLGPVLPKEVDIQGFRERAIKKAGGNLGYLDALGRGLDRAIADSDRHTISALLSLAELPSDLQGLYAFFLHQIKVSLARERVDCTDAETGESYRMAAWPAIHSRILGVLAVAKEPLDLDLIGRLGDIRAERSWLVHAIGQLLLLMDVTNNRYRLYHATVAEFLTDPATHANAKISDLYQTPIGWHRAIANYYLRDQRDWRECDDYGLRNLAEHIISGQQPDRLAQLVSNDWMHARVARDEYRYDGFIGDLRLAWQQAHEKAVRQIRAPSEPLDLASSLRCALVNSSINAISSNYSPSVIKYLVETGTWSVDRALAVADRIPRTTDRVSALVALLQSGRLSTDDYENVRRQALALALSETWEPNLGPALCALAPYLDGELLLQAWAAARHMRSKWQELKAPALAMLASRFPARSKSAALREALAAALSTTLDNNVGASLRVLVPHLGSRLINEALDQVLALPNEGDCARALAVLAPYLGARRSKLAAAEARRVSDARQLTVALALAPHLGSRLVNEALDQVPTLPGERTRTRTLAVLAPHLPGKQQDKVWESCLNVAAHTDSDADRLGMIEALAENLSAGWVDEALNLTLEMENEDLRARGLRALSAKLDAQQAARVLAAAGQMLDKNSRSSALQAVLPHLSGDVYLNALRMALEVDDFNDWSRAMAELVPTMPESLIEEVVRVTSGLEIQWGAERIYLALAPRLKGQTARRALAALEHIRPDEPQAKILTEWVAWLESDLLGQALNLTLAMSDLKARRTVLYALVPRVSGDELQRALAGLSAMDDEYDQYELLMWIYPTMDADRRVPIRERFLGRARLGYAIPYPGNLALAGDDDAFEEVFAITEQSTDPYKREFLKGLSRPLIVANLDRLLEMAIRLGSWEDRAESLAFLAPYLDDTAFDRAVVASDMPPDPAQADSLAWPKLLAALAPRMPQEVREQMIREAFETFRQYHPYFDVGKKAELGVAIAPYAEEHMIEEILGEKRRWENENSRANVLAAVVPRLRLQQIEQLTDIALRMVRDSARAIVFVGLAPHLPPAQLEQVLAAAGRLSEPHSRAIALAALAPRVSPLPRQRSVLMDALDAAEGVLEGPQRVNAIRILAGVLPAELFDRAVEVAQATQSARHRAQALASLLPTAPHAEAVLERVRLAIADHIFTDLSAKGRPELLRFELERSLLTPALVEPSVLDALAAAILEIGRDWTWL